MPDKFCFSCELHNLFAILKEYLNR